MSPAQDAPKRPGRFRCRRWPGSCRRRCRVLGSSRRDERGRVRWSCARRSWGSADRREWRSRLRRFRWWRLWRRQAPCLASFHCFESFHAPDTLSLDRSKQAATTTTLHRSIRSGSPLAMPTNRIQYRKPRKISRLSRSASSSASNPKRSTTQRGQRGSMSKSSKTRCGRNWKRSHYP